MSGSAVGSAVAAGGTSDGSRWRRRAGGRQTAFRTVAVFAAALAGWGCGDLDRADRTPAPDLRPDAEAAGAWASAVTPRPGHAPDRFGFGSPASESRIALWDIDIKPDGEGLPPGSGSVAEGQRIYEVQCVACHGPTGVEGPNDPLAGSEPWGQWPPNRSAGAYWPYATTLFDYIRRAMPQATPGSLSDNEVYAVVAYVLNLGGIVADDAVMDAASLAAVQMPARDRFVPDNRTGGPEVR